MFPVPQHLPRSPTPASMTTQSPEAEAVLDHLEPLFGASAEAGPSTPRRLQLGQVTTVRERLQDAVSKNRRRTHELVLQQYGAISSHIKTSLELTDGIATVSEGTKRLHKEISTHADDQQKSFISPVFESLDTHFALERSHAQAKIRASAFRALKRHVDSLRELQRQVDEGKALEAGVLRELLRPDGDAGAADATGAMRVLEGSRAMAALKTRRAELRSKVESSVRSAWDRTITIGASGRNGRVGVQKRVLLSESKSLNHARSYSIVDLLAALQALGFLPPLLETLRASLVSQLLQPLLRQVKERHEYSYLVPTSTESSTALSAQPIPDAPSADKVIDSCRAYLRFVAGAVFPDLPETAESQQGDHTQMLEVRQTFFTEVFDDLLRSIKDLWVLPSLPLNPAELPEWLSTLQAATAFEDSVLSPSEPENGTRSPFGDVRVSTSPTIRPFFETEAAPYWIARKRESVASQVRELIIGGWQGWESKEVKRQREVVEIVEVEVDMPPAHDGEDARGRSRARAAEGYRVADSAFDGKAAGPEVTRKQAVEAEGEDGFGWGLDQPGEFSRAKAPAERTEPPVESEKAASKQDTEGDAVDDGWGFDEFANPGANGQKEPEPTAPVKPPAETPLAEGEGWDFDMAPASAPAPAVEPQNGTAVPPAQAKPKKPAREAKRLGKKIAQAQAHETAEDDDDPWGTLDDGHERESTADSASAWEGESLKSSEPPAPASMPDPVAQPDSEPAEGWGWDDEPVPQHTVGIPGVSEPRVPSPLPAKSPPRPQKQTVFKKQKKTIEERMLVSRATERLISLAQHVLDEIPSLESLESAFAGSLSPTSGSKVSARDVSEHLVRAAEDVFELYCALLPVHFAPQVRDVPALAMQLHNDCLHLSDRLKGLEGQSQVAGDNEASADGPSAPRVRLKAEPLRRQLVALGEWTFESQLQAQREGLLDTLAGADGFEGTGDDQVNRKAERVVQQVRHEMEGLSRVLKTVLAQTTHLVVMGHLLSVVLSSVTASILSLGDITELESQRLAALLLSLQPLEKLFIIHADPGSAGTSTVEDEAPSQPTAVASYVPPWLRFCYLAELLNASLVDITYLFESGALVDFSTDELVGLVRALFADSDKRDKAVRLIEEGHGGDGGVVDSA